MTSRQRVAVVASAAPQLMEQLAQAAPDLEVRSFGDLCGDADALLRYRPACLFAGSTGAGEELGSLRMLMTLLPRTSFVLVCTAEHEVRVTEAAQRLDVAVLVAPCTQRQVTEMLELVSSPERRTSAEVLLDLARGLSDEINNPLMFTAGHLQLLEQGLRASSDEDALEHVQRIRDGLERITATMQKVRMMAGIAAPAASGEEVDLAPLAQAVADRHAAGDRSVAPPVLVPAAALVRGDATLLEALVEHLCRVTANLEAEPGGGRVEIHNSGGRVALRAILDAKHLPAWQLPRSFDPYYMTRILRGTPHGLGLFLVQVIAHGHGGRAVARWSEPGELCLEVELHAAGAGDEA